MEVVNLPETSVKQAQSDTTSISHERSTRWFSQISSMSTSWLSLYVIYYIIFISLSITQLLTGIRHANECPIDPLIPMYLIVSGAVSIAIVVLSILKNSLPPSWQSARKPKSIQDHFVALVTLEGFLTGVVFVLWLFDLAWFIAGNVWVFRARPSVQFDDPVGRRSTYCVRPAYMYAFWTIIIIYIVMACTWIVRLYLKICRSEKPAS